MDNKEIEDILGEIKCPKDFICYKSGLEVLCKAKDIGLEWFLDCLEENPNYCHFSLIRENSYLCNCPLRVYLMKAVGK